MRVAVPTAPAASPPTRAKDAPIEVAKSKTTPRIGEPEANVPSAVMIEPAAANAAIVLARRRCGPPGSTMLHSQPPSAIQVKSGWCVASPTTSGPIVAVAARSPRENAGRTAASSRLLRTWAPRTGAAGNIAGIDYQPAPHAPRVSCPAPQQMTVFIPIPAVPRGQPG